MASERRVALAGAATSPIRVNTAISGTMDRASSLSFGGFWDDEAGTLSWCRRVGRRNFRLR